MNARLPLISNFTRSFFSKTKILLPAILILLGTLPSHAQQPACGQQVVTDAWFKLHPDQKQKFNILQEQAARTDREQTQCKSTQASSAPAYTVPVVFHILHLGGVENISDAQVRDEIAILNRDYQKQNADTISVVPGFTNNIANVGFAFKLATIDPNGNCTNGIIRHYTSNTDWDANNLSLFTYSWPTNKYLNIYIVRSLNIQATAYAFLPGIPVPSNCDVIVSMHNMCGSIGTSNVAYSRVITHEVGHWFNLQHIWGSSNQPGVVCGDDGVSDTPITKGFTVCPATLNATICTPGVGENYQNYMDYSPCKQMFTNGQAARMLSCMTGTQNNRNNISSPFNLLATGVTSSVSNCIPLVEISCSPSNTLCLGTPLSLISYTSNASVTSYSWTSGSGSSLSSPATASTSIGFTNAGTVLVTCVASNTNGASTASMLITVVNTTAQIAVTNQESFETAFLPANWSVLNPATPAATWSLSTLAGSHGAQSMFVNGENAPGGTIEVLQSPSYDFLNNPGAQLTFKYAYAQKSSTHKDIFKVQASSDCGGTFSDIYVPSAATMANGSGGLSGTLFVPAAFEWKNYNLSQHPNFSSFLNKSNVILRFYFKEDSAGFGNRFYLDQINFDSPTGVNEYTRSLSLKLFPNPGNSESQLEFTLSRSTDIKVAVCTSAGQVVYEKQTQNYQEGTHRLLLNTGETLCPGIYFVNADFGGMRVQQKWVVVE